MPSAGSARGSGAGVRTRIDVKQAGGIDRCIDLRRGKAGVAEQLLQAAQVSTGRQEMGGEAVPQGVRRGAVSRRQGAHWGVGRALAARARKGDPKTEQQQEQQGRHCK